MQSTAGTRASNPFPGLRPFQSWESDIFYGRDREVYQLLNRLRLTHFLAVVGSSGCGKSSLVRAGLIAALEDGFMVEHASAWRIVQTQPRNAPIAELSRALVKTFAGDSAGLDEHGIMQSALRRGSLGLAEAIRDAALPEGSKVLVLVDQFEELFHFVRRARTEGARLEDAVAAVEEAKAFVKLLLDAAAAGDVQAYIVIAMRSEFLGLCSDYAGLAEAINDGIYLVPQMGRDQFRECIEDPIAERGGRIADRLVNRLLNDVAEQSDQLPLLQHALMRMWASVPSDDATLDIGAYEAIGELGGGLDQHAEEIFDKLSPEQRALAEAMFRTITDMTTDAAGAPRKVRKPATLAAIAARVNAPETDVVAVLDEFRSESRSFLTPPGPLTSDSLIDISHESLIRQWKRLGAWVDDESRITRAQRDLADQAARWQSSNQNEAYLFRGLELSEAEALFANRRSRLGEVERQFLDASSAARDREAEIRWLDQRMADWIAQGRRRKHLLRGDDLVRAAKIERVEAAQSQFVRAGIDDSLRSRRIAKIRWVAAVITFLAAVIALWGWQNSRALAKGERKQREQLIVESERKLEKVESNVLDKLWGQALGETPAAGGGSTPSSQVPGVRPPRPVPAVSQAEQAAKWLGNVGPEQRRNDIRIFYFKKAAESTLIDELLIPTWEYYGFTVEKKEPLYRAPTNIIWIGRKVPLRDMKIVACTLIRAGVRLRDVRWAARNPAKENVIQVGALIGLNHLPVWTVKQVLATTELGEDR